jgi:hypothetical protein
MICYFWDVTQCGLINSYRRFGEANCIHLQRPTHLLQRLDPECEGSRLLRNVCNYLGLRSEIWGSHGGIDEDSSLLECYTMLTAWPCRWKQYSPPKICNYLPVDMASHARDLDRRQYRCENLKSFNRDYRHTHFLPDIFPLLRDYGSVDMLFVRNITQE